jgi:hypothetical protein
MIRRFRTVVPNKLYRGSAPSPNDVMELKEKLGINKIVSLDQKAGDRIVRACKLLGIEHIKLYIDWDRKTLYHALNQNLKHLLIDDGPTYLHCERGKDRTGLIVALFKCKYLGMEPHQALAEAKSLGFGIGMHPATVNLYQKLILSCQQAKPDQNSADIVSNEREYVGDNRDSFLDEVHRGDFSAQLDHTKQDPMDALYPHTMDQVPSRENYPDTSLFQHDPNMTITAPNVGDYDNESGLAGAGPVERVDGWFSEIGQ